MAKTPPTSYLFHGEDEYTRKAEVNAMREAMNDPVGLNIMVMDGAQVSARDVLSAASSIPFLADKRLIIVEGMLAHLNKKSKSAQAELDVLAAGLPDLPDFARLVLHENTTLSARALKPFQENPRIFIREFNAPQNIEGWIVKQAEKVYNAKIEPDAAKALATVVEKDIRAADNELAKLSAYVNGERPITTADVKLLTTYVPEPDVFRMVDAIGQQDGKQAMRICTELLIDQEALSLFGMIHRQFRLLILAKEHMDQGGALSGLASAIGVHPFVAQKLGGQAKNFSLEQLENIYRSLANYDYSIKTGKISDEMALQLFIAGVTR